MHVLPEKLRRRREAELLGIGLNGDILEAGADWPDEKRVTSRENVAEVIAHVIKTGAASRQTVNFYDGETPIGEAISRA